MDYDRALAAVNEYLTLLKLNHGYYSSSRQRPPEYRETYDVLVARIPAIASIGDRVSKNFRSRLVFSQITWPFYEIEREVTMLLGILRDRREVDEIIGASGPQLAAAQLHPTVWAVAARLWDGGHYRQAVESAATAVNDELRAKTGRVDVSGTDLVTQSFKIPETPKPGTPRLRFVTLDPTDRDTWTNAHEGAMHFGRGCMMAIRNIVSHHPDELDPQDALEKLAALSVLARWIDDATVVVDQ